jgi:hypothetical protein
MEYQINLNEAQVRVLERATEIYFRMGLAQFDYAVDMGFNVPSDKMEDVRILCDRLKYVCTGMPRQQSYGVGSKELSEYHNIAHDVNQVLRHRLSWDDKPEGGNGVTFYTPFKINPLPLPTIKRTDSTTTKDGWSTVKPKTPGLYEARIADERNPTINIIRITKVDGVLWAKNIKSKTMIKHNKVLLSKVFDFLHWRKVKKL